MADAGGSIQEGSTVQLKSGGPVMTVTGKNGNGDWICTWFDGNEAKYGAYPGFALKISTPGW